MYKFYSRIFFGAGLPNSQILRVMKLVILLLTVAILQVSANKLNLVVSLLMDGGISYLLLSGIKAMIGNKGLLPQSAEKNNEYKNALTSYEKQQTQRLAEMLQRSGGGSEETRSYTRSGSSR